MDDGADDGAAPGYSHAMHVDFWFDYSCPYAYAACGLVDGVAARTGATIRYRPFLLGGVFRALGTSQNLAATMSPQKAVHLLHDQQRALVRAGLPLHFPTAHPRRTVHALRATLAAGRRGDNRSLIRAFFLAYWAENSPIEDEEFVRAVASAHGFADLDLEAEREPLRVATDEALAAGVFGAPAFTLSLDPKNPDAKQFFWGHDRLDFVEHALGGAMPGVHAPLDPPVEATIDFWFDYGSPFAFLAATQMRGLSERTGAVVRPRPFLLGAVFRALGQADVPLFAFSDAKRRWYLRDLVLWSRRWGMPFQFSPHFPLRTVLALRCTLAHPNPSEFSERVFRAAWIEGRNINDPAVLEDLGGDPANAESQRDALFANTHEAIATGVFGTPTFILRRPGQPAQRFWGQDRIDQIEDVLHGWQAPGTLT